MRFTAMAYASSAELADAVHSRTRAPSSATTYTASRLWAACASARALGAARSAARGGRCAHLDVVANEESTDEWLLDACVRLALHIVNPLQNRQRARVLDERLHDVTGRVVLDVVEVARAIPEHAVVVVVGANVDGLEGVHGGAVTTEKRQR